MKVVDFMQFWNETQEDIDKALDIKIHSRQSQDGYAFVDIKMSVVINPNDEGVQTKCFLIIWEKND